MGQVIFITGSVRSGKSAFAESYTKELFKKNNCEHLFYIASGVAFDEEMEKRIQRHKQDREDSDIKWITIECTDSIPEELDMFQNNDVILWDCITKWLSNILYKTEQLDETKRLLEIERYMNKLKQQILTWKENNIAIVFVSNEVLDEMQSDFKEVNLYCHILGDLHQFIVSVCDEAYEMDYSLKHRWK